jgi:hypothetical protein
VIARNAYQNKIQRGGTIIAYPLLQVQDGATPRWRKDRSVQAVLHGQILASRAALAAG